METWVRLSDKVDFLGWVIFKVNYYVISCMVFFLLSWVYLDLGSDQVRGAQRVGLLQVIRKNWSAEQIRFFCRFFIFVKQSNNFRMYLTNHHNFSSHFLLTRYWTCRWKTLHIPLTLNLLISRQAFSLSAQNTPTRVYFTANHYASSQNG